MVPHPLARVYQSLDEFLYVHPLTRRFFKNTYQNRNEYTV